MSGHPHHWSPPSSSEPPKDPRRMVDVQPSLPPPTFLGNPDYGYSSHGLPLPSLPQLYQSHIMSQQGPPHDQRGPAPQLQQPQHQEKPVSARPTAQAVPISALLSDPEPEKVDHSNRTDSIVSHAQASAQSVLPPPGRYAPPIVPQYVQAIPQYQPHHAGHSPTSPTAPNYPPPPGYRFPDHVGAPQQIAAPIFTAPFGAPPHMQPYQHHRQRSSVHSPTSASSGSPRPFHEPHPTVSEASMAAHAFPNMPEPAEPELEYRLIMRQQPKAARACGFGERDRRVIDPPPIIEVQAYDPITGETRPESDSYTTLHCGLVDAATGNDCSTVPAPSRDSSSAQRLMGSAVASPWVGNDENKVRGSFFVFADLSVRSPGRYKLKFRLIKVNPLAITKIGKNYIKAAIDSEPFDVFTAKEFPGMRASSALLRALRSQGLNVGVKKGSDMKKGGKKGDDDDGSDDGDSAGSDDEEDQSEEEVGPSEKRVKTGRKDDEHPEGGKGKGKAKSRRSKG